MMCELQKDSCSLVTGRTQCATAERLVGVGAGGRDRLGRQGSTAAQPPSAKHRSGTEITISMAADGCGREKVKSQYLWLPTVVAERR